MATSAVAESYQPARPITCHCLFRFTRGLRELQNKKSKYLLPADIFKLLLHRHKDANEKDIVDGVWKCTSGRSQCWDSRRTAEDMKGDYEDLYQLLQWAERVTKIRYRSHEADDQRSDGLLCEFYQRDGISAYCLNLGNTFIKVEQNYVEHLKDTGQWPEVMTQSLVEMFPPHGIPLGVADVGHERWRQARYEAHVRQLFPLDDDATDEQLQMRSRSVRPRLLCCDPGYSEWTSAKASFKANVMSMLEVATPKFEEIICCQDCRSADRQMRIDVKAAREAYPLL